MTVLAPNLATPRCRSASLALVQKLVPEGPLLGCTHEREFYVDSTDDPVIVEDCMTATSTVEAVVSRLLPLLSPNALGASTCAKLVAVPCSI